MTVMVKEDAACVSRVMAVELRHARHVMAPRVWTAAPVKQLDASPISMQARPEQ